MSLVDFFADAAGFAFGIESERPSLLPASSENNKGSNTDNSSADKKEDKQQAHVKENDQSKQDEHGDDGGKLPTSNCDFLGLLLSRGDDDDPEKMNEIEENDPVDESMKGVVNASPMANLREKLQKFKKKRTSERGSSSSCDYSEMDLILATTNQTKILKRIHRGRFEKQGHMYRMVTLGPKDAIIPAPNFVLLLKAPEKKNDEQSQHQNLVNVAVGFVLAKLLASKDPSRAKQILNDVQETTETMTCIDVTTVTPETIIPILQTPPKFTVSAFSSDESDWPEISTPVAAVSSYDSDDNDTSSVSNQLERMLRNVDEIPMDTIPQLLEEDNTNDNDPIMNILKDLAALEGCSEVPFKALLSCNDQSGYCMPTSIAVADDKTTVTTTSMTDDSSTLCSVRDKAQDDKHEQEQENQASLYQEEELIGGKEDKSNAFDESVCEGEEHQAIDDDKSSAVEAKEERGWKRTLGRCAEKAMVEPCEIFWDRQSRRFDRHVNRQFLLMAKSGIRGISHVSLIDQVEQEEEEEQDADFYKDCDDSILSDTRTIASIGDQEQGYTLPLMDWNPIALCVPNDISDDDSLLVEIEKLNKANMQATPSPIAVNPLLLCAGEEDFDDDAESDVGSAFESIASGRPSAMTKWQGIPLGLEIPSVHIPLELCVAPAMSLDSLEAAEDDDDLSVDRLDLLDRVQVFDSIHDFHRPNFPPVPLTISVSVEENALVKARRTVPPCDVELLVRFMVFLQDSWEKHHHHAQLFSKIMEAQKDDEALA